MIVIYKTFKYRIYPSKEQIKRLCEWMSVSRFLWNLALEQRLAGWKRLVGEKIFPSSFSQGVELTELRKDYDWIRDVPRHILVSILDNLDKSWKRFFSGISEVPRWKNKSSSHCCLKEFDSIAFALRDKGLKFPKLGLIPIRLHRPLEGRPKSCTIKKDGNQWFACVQCEIEIPEPIKRTEPVVGLDRGITHFLATSDGRLVDNPKHLEKSLARLARAQRRFSRRRKGSKRREKAKLRVAKIHQKIRRQREHTLHVESHRLAKSHGVVVIEDLNVAGMIRSKLSRHIADVGWSKFATFLKYKLEWSGGELVKVPAQYSSQTCFACKAVDKASRRGNSFECTSCGNKDHADLNAAKVIKSRANRSALIVEGNSMESLRSDKLRLHDV